MLKVKLKTISYSNIMTIRVISSSTRRVCVCVCVLTVRLCNRMNECMSFHSAMCVLYPGMHVCGCGSVNLARDDTSQYYSYAHCQPLPWRPNNNLNILWSATGRRPNPTTYFFSSSWGETKLSLDLFEFNTGVRTGRASGRRDLWRELWWRNNENNRVVC